MHIKLPLAIRQEPVYPSGMAMSELDRLIDIVMELYPHGEAGYEEFSKRLMKRWGFDTMFGEELGLKTVQDIICSEEFKRFLTLDSDGTLMLDKPEEWYDEKLERPEAYKELCQQVVTAFNTITGRKVALPPPRERLITRRLKEGAKLKDHKGNPKPIGLAQFEAVFRHKFKEWNGTDMDKYIEIETLCSEKFYKYLDAARQAFVNEKKAGVTIAAGHVKPWQVIVSHADKVLWLMQDLPADTKDKIEAGSLESVFKDDLYELADRRARDYAKEKSYTFNPTLLTNGPSTNEILSPPGLSNSIPPSGNDQPATDGQ